jgi:hypothetical protein
MTMSAAGSTAAPELQTSWTRAEAACAARHRGDTYYALTHPQPKPYAAPASSASAAPTGPLTPGFTLHL